MLALLEKETWITAEYQLSVWLKDQSVNCDLRPSSHRCYGNPNELHRRLLASTANTPSDEVS